MYTLRIVRLIHRPDDEWYLVALKHTNTVSNPGTFSSQAEMTPDEI